VRKRLAIENDEKLFSLKDCLFINEEVGVPVIFDSIIFDSFHHLCLNSREALDEAVSSAIATWSDIDRVLMTDYSSQEHYKKKGGHAIYINVEHFGNYPMQVKDYDFDITLEIKDKEKSALKAFETAKNWIWKELKESYF
jgi:UV DNA damage endonuclease